MKEGRVRQFFVGISYYCPAASRERLFFTLIFLPPPPPGIKDSEGKFKCFLLVQRFIFTSLVDMEGSLRLSLTL